MLGNFFFSSTGAAAAYQIDQSLRFSTEDDEQISRQLSTDGNRKTWTFSAWIKRAGDLTDRTYLFAGYGGTTDTTYFSINIDHSSQQLKVTGFNVNYFISNMLFRDPSAWYHIVVACDTTQSTASNRLKVYVNGSQISGTTTDLTLNQDTGVHIAGTSSSYGQYVGSEVNNLHGNHYLAEVHLIDGAQKAPTDFGETNDDGVWVAKSYSGSHGTQGAYLKFDPTLFPHGVGHDHSGNANHYTVTSVTGGDPNISDSKYATTFDGSGDYITISNSGDHNPGSGDFTIEGWFKTSASVSYQTIISKYGSPGNYNGWYISLDSAGTGFNASVFDGSSTQVDLTGGSNLNNGIWHHFAVTRSGTSLKLFIDGRSVDSATNSFNISATSDVRISGYPGNTRDWNGSLSNIRIVKGQALYTSNFSPSRTALTTTSQGATASNVKLLTCQADPIVDNSSAAHTLSIIDNTSATTSSPFSNEWSLNLPSAGNSVYCSPPDLTGEFNIECWFKSDGGSEIFGNWGTGIFLRIASGQLQFYSEIGHLAATFGYDNLTWHHVAVSRDSSNVVRLFGDGTQLNSATYSGTITMTNLAIGAENTGGGSSIRGYIKDFRIVDGQALYTASFTPPTETLTTTSQGATASNVTLLTAQDATIHDNSEDHRALTIQGSSTTTYPERSLIRDPDTDVFLDTPTNNYATFSVIDHLIGSATFDEGNLEVTTTSSGTARAVSTIRPTSGKWYCEFTVNDATRFSVGVENGDRESSAQGGASTNSVIVFYNRSAYFDGNASASYYLDATISNGDIIQVALDLDNSAVWVGRNNNWGNSATDTEISNGTTTNSLSTFISATNALTGDVGIFVEDNSSSGSMTATANFGQRAFAYTPPTGFKALNTANLPAPTVKDGSKHFDTKLYTANSQSAQTISGLEFSPDLLWFKTRGRTEHHYLYDQVRGAGNRISSSQTIDEVTGDNSLTAFTSDGFTLGADGAGIINYQTDSMVAWAWDAGTSNTSVSVGDLNTTAYNISSQSTTWSSLGTNDHSSPYNWEATFDGDSSTWGAIPTVGDAAVVDFSSLSGGGISYTSSVKVTYNRNTSAPDVTINGTAISATADGTDRTYTLSGSGTLASVGTETRTASSSGDCAIKKIVVDGRELVDYGFTATVNFPSIATTVRANSTAGFSIVSYTGTGSAGTVAHGLGVAPSAVIVKNRDDNTKGWPSQFAALGNNYLELNSTTDTFTGSGYFNNTAPTSSVFSVGTLGSVNASGDDFIAYCFAEVEGYSKIGTYTGNGSSDGPFIYTGFTPAFILVKWYADVNSAESWQIYDTKRLTYNPNDAVLYPDSNTQEENPADRDVDILSNGFKWRADGQQMNRSGASYVFVAFASNPFGGNDVSPATAR